jgi:DNA-binding MarR family transcriptional regulator
MVVGTAIVCQRHLRRARGEYEKSKETVEDIVLSFNRQLEREAQKLGVLAYKVESIDSKSDRALHAAEQTSTQVAKPDDKKEITERLSDLEGKIRDVVVSQEALVAKITLLEDKTRQFFTLPEVRSETVIPLKREKALAQLTETEFTVLEMLLSEGPKTAPAVRGKVKLSREHTARLMKKLYEEGYLERQTGRIPFKYTVKKEMRKLLKRPDQWP